MRLEEFSPEIQERILYIEQNVVPTVLMEEDCGKKNYDPNEMDSDLDKRENLYRPLVEKFILDDEELTVETHYVNPSSHSSVFNYNYKDYTYGSV